MAWLDSGVRLIQLRAKTEAFGLTLELGTQCSSLCAAAGATFIVNDRIDVALLAAADGVHVGQDDLPSSEVKRIAPEMAVGLSTHNAEQVRASLALEVALDYVAIGPVFTTQTKRGVPDPVVGLSGIRTAAGLLSESKRPLVGIGGITLTSAASVITAGASSVAVISDLMTDDWPLRARDFLKVMDDGAEPV